MKIKRRPGKPGAGKLEKVPARRKAGGCEEGSSKKKLKAKPKESLRAAVTGGPSSAAPPSACSLFGAADPRHFGAREDGARLASERLKKATRKSKVLQSALRVSARLGGAGGHRVSVLLGMAEGLQGVGVWVTGGAGNGKGTTDGGLTRDACVGGAQVALCGAG